MRRGSLLAIIAVASAREKPTSRAARRARKAWLNGTKPPTLNTFYFYVDRDDPRNTTVPPSIATMIARAQRDARRWGVDIWAEVHGFVMNVTGCSTFSRKRGTGAGHGSRGHG